MVDYLNELRESILESYTGVIQGLKGDAGLNPEVILLESHIPFITQFIKAIATDEEKNDGTICAAVGLIG